MKLNQLTHNASAVARSLRFLITFSGLFIAGAMTIAPIPATAQSVNSPLGGFTKGNKGPIDIQADELVIKQKENIAIFSGKVNVTQGKFTLKSSRLVVKYLDAGKDGKGKREISQLDATGGVIVTSDNQSATGDWATMDVKKNIIIMGDNVVLSQEGSVIHGSKVLVDLNTGYSQILSGKKNGGRVRAVFEPKKK